MGERHDVGAQAFLLRGQDVSSIDELIAKLGAEAEKIDAIISTHIGRADGTV